jgi:ligand-binding SRPBCC domain-containing protein
MTWRRESRRLDRLPYDPPVPMVRTFRLRLHALPIRWLTRIESWERGRRFADIQIRGPYRLWHHTHRFDPHEAGTRMRDVVRYALPLGPLGRLAREVVVRRDLERIFDFRRDAVAALSGLIPPEPPRAVERTAR